MFDPNNRQLYLDGLRPPEGFIFDRAIATTFSLDLMSLLMAPLSMCLFEYQNKRDALNDPIAVLEALKRTTHNMAIFCQKGRIAIPKMDSRLYSNLEPVVIETQPDGDGVFHPKIWLLRFKDDERVCYRLLCLSRNLTFDRSWDTILSIEQKGDLKEKPYSRNIPLADFIKALPTLAVGEITPNVQKSINLMAEEVLRVNFEPPDGFEKIAFKPLGINGYKKPPSFKGHSRLLIMSPFLSGKCLRPLIDNGSENVLISRVESLDALNEKTYNSIEENSCICIMDDVTEQMADPEIEDSESSESFVSDNLSGLHGKLFISEEGWNARILTGSANATSHAFNGNNVEFLVELIGKKSQVGIDRFLGKNDEGTSLLSLLRPYQRPEAQEVDTIRQKLEDILEMARCSISNAVLSLKVIQISKEIFSLNLKSDIPFSLGDEDVKGRCYPISLKSHDSIDITPLLNGKTITFSNVSIMSLTGFIAFEFTAYYKKQKTSISFVLNLPIEGMPSDRDKRILHNIISNKDRFIRYLFFLLAEGNETFRLRELLNGAVSNDTNDKIQSYIELPLLEELVRAYSRNPEKIDRISKLIEDFIQFEEGRNLLPEGFDQIWGAFLKPR